MTQLLGLSFDVATSPSIRLKAFERTEPSLDATYGWGLAWYPSDGAAAMVIKDPTSVGTNALTNVLSDWERFSATVFVAHLRGAAKRIAQQDTHPFARSHAGRDWVLTHNGDLRRGFREVLKLPADTPFEPVGATDSEHLLCWLLGQLRAAGARRLGDVPPDRLIGWLRRLNELGTLNLLLSDGSDVLAYSDAFGYRPLWWIRHVPPNPLITVSDDEVELHLGTTTDLSRTAVIVSSRALSDGAWARIEPGCMLLARRGAVTWQSGPLPEDWHPTRAVPAPDLARLRAGDADAATRLSRTLEVAARSAPPPEPALFPAPPRRARRRRDAVELDLLAFQDGGTRPADPATTDALRRAATELAAPEVLLAGLDREEGDDQKDLLEAPRILETWHETVYEYAEPVELSAHVFRLQPVHDLGQELLDFRLHLEPACALRTFEDVFGNTTTETRIREPYRRLRILAQSRVRLVGQRRHRLRASGEASRLPLVWMPWQRQMMLPYLLPPELPETQLRELSDYARSFVERQDGDLVETLKDINRSLHGDFSYVPASTQLETTPFQVYAQRKGVCQDFANLFIALARLLSIPARYRVGYIFTGGRYANTHQGDASHAWVEVYLPHVGWRGFDPTNGTVVGDDHVRVACGRNFRDATPTGGTLYAGGGRETLKVDVRVLDVTGKEPTERFEIGGA